jgi:GT2 family glycosyltransferase
MNAAPTCDIVIVNWNTGPLLARCLGSLKGAQSGVFRLGTVVVVDNASTDGSADAGMPAPPALRLLRNPRNEGFARACNQGAAAASGSHILFLNPDTSVPGDCLDRLFAWLAARPDFARAIVGIQLVDAEGRISVTCSRFPTLRGVLAKTLGLERPLARFGWSQPMLEFDHCESRAVDQVMGAFLLIPRALFNELGGFSEKYFLYYEEVDLCRRAHLLGAPVVFCAETSATHIGGGSSASVPVRRLFLNLRSRLIYYRANFGWPAFSAAAFLTLAVEPLTRLLRLALGWRLAGMGDVLRAYGRLYRNLFRPST